MLFAFKIVLWSFQIAAFLVAAISWKKYKSSSQKHFIFFLGFVVIVEIMGYLIPKLYDIKSQFIYNTYTICSIFFFLYWYSIILKRTHLIKIFSYIFAVSVVIAIFKEDFFLKLWRIPLTTGTVLILICSGIFYYNLLNSNKVYNYQKSQEFWIVTGLLIFYIGFLPLQLLQPYLNITSIAYVIALTSLNILLYGFFTVSFLCNKKD